MTDHYSLIFKGDHNNSREITKIATLDESGCLKTYDKILNEAVSIIHTFCSEHNFRIHYTRMWNRGGITIFDVGSHTEFFHLLPPIDSHYNGEDAFHG